MDPMFPLEMPGISVKISNAAGSMLLLLVEEDYDSKKII